LGRGCLTADERGAGGRELMEDAPALRFFEAAERLDPESPAVLNALAG
jgi:hypothetical protein